MDIKKEKKTFGKIFAIELQLFPEAAQSTARKKNEPNPLSKIVPLSHEKISNFPPAHE